MTNGIQPGPRAEYTCHHNKGESVIDYILSTEANTRLQTDDAVLFNIADHSLVYTHLPICYTGKSPLQPNNQHTTHHNRSSHPQPTQTFYKWIEGEDISEYSASANKWKTYTTT
jgi:hypothetical protein